MYWETMVPADQYHGLFFLDVTVGMDSLCKAYASPAEFCELLH